MLKPDIQKTLLDLYPASVQKLSKLSPGQWMETPIPGKWSIAEQLNHLLLSGYSIGSLLKQPDAFFTTFGSATGNQKSYDELYKAYLKVNNGTLIATSRFTPKKEELQIGEEGLAAWEALIYKTHGRLATNWDEDRLDQTQFPHPAMGIMTMRELMYFKIFHTKHHYLAIDRLIKLLNQKDNIV